jgi:protein involved in polysaccharide export with SLBB domain
MTREQMSETEYEYYVMKQNSTTINTVVVDFFSLLIENDLNEDVKLQDKDIIRIPQKTEMIFVTGRIANPGGIIYKSGADFKYYIEKAGGYTWDADSKRTKIIKVTGEIVEKEDFKTFTPGDRIWIPRKKDRDLWQLFRDAVFTLSQIATIYLIIRTATE